MDELQLSIGDKIELDGAIYKVDIQFDDKTLGLVMLKTKEGIPQNRFDGGRVISAIQLLKAKK